MKSALALYESYGFDKKVQWKPLGIRTRLDDQRVVEVFEINVIDHAWFESLGKVPLEQLLSDTAMSANVAILSMATLLGFLSAELLEFNYQDYSRRVELGKDARTATEDRLFLSNLENKKLADKLREKGELMQFLVGAASRDVEINTMIERLIYLKNLTRLTRNDIAEMEGIFERLDVRTSNKSKIKKLRELWLPQGQGVKQAPLNTKTLAQVTPGGIALKAKDLKMDIQKQGASVQVAIDPALMEQFESGSFAGVIPIIIKVTPINGAWDLLGLAVPSSQPIQLAGV